MKLALRHSIARRRLSRCDLQVDERNGSTSIAVLADELAAIACNVAFDDAARHWRKRMQRKKDKREAFNSIVGGYLPRRNRDDPADACPSATLVSDVARELADKPVRSSHCW